jgi:hypothetical protein
LSGFISIFHHLATKELEPVPSLSETHLIKLNYFNKVITINPAEASDHNLGAAVVQTQHVQHHELETEELIDVTPQGQPGRRPHMLLRMEKYGEYQGTWTLEGGSSL